MIFDSLRDRITVSIDIPKRRKSTNSATAQKPPRKRRTLTHPTVKRMLKQEPSAKRKTEPRPKTTPTSYGRTTGGLFYATGRDGTTQGYPRLSGWFIPGRTYYYWISLDERGDFMAAVDDDRGKKVMSIASAEDLQELIDAGYMKHGKDVAGLEEYLQEVGIIESNDKLVYGDWSGISLVEDDDDDEEDGSLADSLADLAGITESELEVANKINERLEYLDEVFHFPIRVFCTKSKKSPYMVRRMVADCNYDKAVDRTKQYIEGKSANKYEFSSRASELRQIGMGPKSRAKYFPKHYGVTWEYIVDMSNKQFTVKNRIQEHLDKQVSKNAEKITAVSTKRAEREARIAQTRADRESRRAAEAERIAKRREEREAKRKPAKAPEPVIEREPEAQPKARPARPARTPKAKPMPSEETVKPTPSKPVVPMETKQMEPTSTDLDSIEADIKNLTQMMQAIANKN